MIAFLLRKLKLIRPEEATVEEFVQATQENAVWDNNEAFEENTQIRRRRASKATNVLIGATEAAQRVYKTPFSDLEDLTKLRQRRDRRSAG